MGQFCTRYARPVGALARVRRRGRRTLAAADGERRPPHPHVRQTEAVPEGGGELLELHRARRQGSSGAAQAGGEGGSRRPTALPAGCHKPSRGGVAAREGQVEDHQRPHSVWRQRADAADGVRVRHARGDVEAADARLLPVRLGPAGCLLQHGQMGGVRGLLGLHGLRHRRLLQVPVLGVRRDRLSCLAAAHGEGAAAGAEQRRQEARLARCGEHGRVHGRRSRRASSAPLGGGGDTAVHGHDGLHELAGGGGLVEEEGRPLQDQVLHRIYGGQRGAGGAT